MIFLSEVSDVCFKAFFISVCALHHYSGRILVVLSLNTSDTAFVYPFFMIAAPVSRPRCMYKRKNSLLKYFHECFVKNYRCFNLTAFSFKFVSPALLWSYCQKQVIVFISLFAFSLNRLPFVFIVSAFMNCFIKSKCKWCLFRLRGSYWSVCVPLAFQHLLMVVLFIVTLCFLVLLPGL